MTSTIFAAGTFIISHAACASAQELTRSEAASLLKPKLQAVSVIKGHNQLSTWDSGDLVHWRGRQMVRECLECITQELNRLMESKEPITPELVAPINRQFSTGFKANQLENLRQIGLKGIVDRYSLAQPSLILRAHLVTRYATLCPEKLSNDTGMAAKKCLARLMLGS